MADLINDYSDQIPSYNAIVDQVSQNNAFSAQQAQKQMEYQSDMFNKANRFNHDEAELNRAFQQESADKAMAFSSAENEKNRQWQKMMSDTAHQREMSDLRAAGLNPILAANNGASAGAGSAAISASAAGYGASSNGAPAGSKADADQSGTMAIANLLGKMLDNQTEIQKMITSAETARETAEMYTGATRYAAELAQIASQYGSDNSYAASKYAADTAAATAANNPYNIAGGLINEALNFVKAGGSDSAMSLGKDNGLQKAHDTLQGFAGKIFDKVSGKESSYDRTRRFIDTAGTGNKLPEWIRNIINKLNK